MDAVSPSRTQVLTFWQNQISIAKVKGKVCVRERRIRLDTCVGLYICQCAVQVWKFRFLWPKKGWKLDSVSEKEGSFIDTDERTNEERKLYPLPLFYSLFLSRIDRSPHPSPSARSRIVTKWQPWWTDCPVPTSSSSRKLTFSLGSVGKNGISLAWLWQRVLPKAIMSIFFKKRESQSTFTFANLRSIEDASGRS